MDDDPFSELDDAVFDDVDAADGTGIDQSDPVLNTNSGICSLGADSAALLFRSVLYPRREGKVHKTEWLWYQKLVVVLNTALALHHETDPAFPVDGFFVLTQHGAELPHKFRRGGIKWLRSSGPQLGYVLCACWHKEAFRRQWLEATFLERYRTCQTFFKLGLDKRCPTLPIWTSLKASRIRTDDIDQTYLQKDQSGGNRFIFSWPWFANNDADDPQVADSYDTMTTKELRKKLQERGFLTRNRPKTFGAPKLSSVERQAACDALDADRPGLSATNRELLILRNIDNLDLDTIAEKMQEKRSYVKSRLGYLKKQEREAPPSDAEIVKRLRAYDAGDYDAILDLLNDNKIKSMILERGLKVPQVPQVRPLDKKSDVPRAGKAKKMLPQQATLDKKLEVLRADIARTRSSHGTMGAEDNARNNRTGEVLGAFIDVLDGDFLCAPAEEVRSRTTAGAVSYNELGLVCAIDYKLPSNREWSKQQVLRAPQDPIMALIFELHEMASKAGSNGFMKTMPNAEFRAWKFIELGWQLTMDSTTTTSGQGVL